MYTTRGYRLYRLFPSLLRVVIRVGGFYLVSQNGCLYNNTGYRVLGAVTKELLKQEARGNQIADMRLILSRRLKFQAYPDH